MEIAYAVIEAPASDWPEVCGWLDHNCPGWLLANHHSQHIERFRKGGKDLAFRDDDPVAQTVKVSAKEATILKLFFEKVDIRWSGEEMTVEERMVAVELAEYNGYWREMGCELLGETTIRMIKQRVRDRDRREAAARRREGA